MVEVMKIMVTSLKRLHACTAMLSAPIPAAGHHRPTPLPETLGGHKQNLVHLVQGERSSDPTGDCPGLACGCLGVSGRGVGWWWPAARLGALSVAVHAWDLLREVTIIFISSTIVWEHSSTHQQKIGLKIY